MPKPIEGGNVDRHAFDLLFQLLDANEAAYSTLGQHINAGEKDEAIAVLLEVAERNGMATVFAALRKEGLINAAEAYLSERTMR